MVTLRPAEGPAALSGVEQAAISYQATGPVYLVASLLPVATPEVAWQGMNDLHQRSIDEAIKGNSRADELTPAEAFTTWSNSLAGVLAQISVVDPDAADQLLGSMTDFSAFQGGLAGLESPFLSAYLASGQGGEITPNMQQAANLVGQVGLPRVLGGGADTSPILDSMMQSLTFADHDQLDQVSAARSGRELLQNLKDLTTSGRPSGTGSGPTGSGPTGSGQTGGSGGSNQLTASVITTAIGLATTALIGGPVGVVGGVIFGGIALLSSLLGGSSPADTQAQAKPGANACSGTTVVVDRPIVINNNQGTIIIGPGGQVVNGGPTPAPSAPPAPSSGPSPAREAPPAPQPEPENCPVGDDDTVVGFALPFWKTDVSMTPSLSAVGDGLASLVSTSRGDVVHMAELPTMDLSARVGDPGLLAGVLEPELTRGSVAELEPAAQQLLLRAATVHALQAAGIGPETPLQVAVDSMRFLTATRAPRVGRR